MKAVELPPVASVLASARFATEASVRDRGGAVVLTISVGEEHTQVALTRDAADALGLALLKMGFDGAAFGGPPRAAAHRAWCAGLCGGACRPSPRLCEHGSVADCCSRCHDG